MVKTRSQSLNLKNENEDTKTFSKHSQLLNDTDATIKTRNKIAERNSTTKNKDILSFSKVKLEEEIDNKSLLQISQPRKVLYITKEQIKQLISYIVHSKMSIRAASKKVNMSHVAGCKYYNIYKNDPERKIPEPWNSTKANRKKYTPDKIKALIAHIENDGMPLSAASRKVNMSTFTANKYYKLYKNYPKHKIPQAGNQSLKKKKCCTNRRIKAAIADTTNSEMSLSNLSTKVNTSKVEESKYNNMCKKESEQKIPRGLRKAIFRNGVITYDQVKALINYIVNDKMTITNASKKANMGSTSGHKYYQLYKNDPDRNIPKPWNQTMYANKQSTYDQIKALISYIVNDKMSVFNASIKANMGLTTARDFYNKYKDDPERKIPKPWERTSNSNRPISYNQVKALISHIVNDKLSVSAAAKKLNVSKSTARKYYLRYWNSPNHEIPVPRKSVSLFLNEYRKKKKLVYQYN